MSSTNLVRPLGPNEKHVGWIAVNNGPTKYLMGQNGGRVYTTPGRAHAAWARGRFGSRNQKFEDRYTLHPVIIEVS